MMQFACISFIGALLLQSANAIPVDNGVEGDPEIECGPTAMTINFNTRNPFEGHVFVKGLFSDEGCRSSEGGSRVAGITLPFETCNVQRIRSLNPNGLFISATVIITFHPQFITKVDRAYTVQCFYMEADKTVSTELEVSMLTTAFQTQTVPMPICRYEILDGPTGNIVQYALVGQAVYHKWTCDTETTDTFCMTVHSCFVDDGQGDRADLLDENGCAIDRYLLRNLEYLSDLMAGQETHVFKYADRPQLFFQCQIAITIKEPDNECPVPQCSEPDRGKRSVARIASQQQQQQQQQQQHGTVDVATHMESLDLQEHPEPKATPSFISRHPQHHSRSLPTFLQQPSALAQDQYCLSFHGFSILVAVVVVTALAGVVSMALLCMRKR